jgi:HSP20 family protein
MANKLKVKGEKSTKIEPVQKSGAEEVTIENEGAIFNVDGELVVDVFETDSDFVVLAAIAGVQIKDLDISVEKEMMIIKGDRQDPHDHPEKKYFYQECYWGPFSRKIVLPENIDTQSAHAEMDKGMLTVRIPKIVETN